MTEHTKAHQEKVKGMRQIKTAYNNAEKLGLVKTKPIFYEDNMTDKNLRMIFFVRTDLKMPKGKIAAQVGHAVQNLVTQAWIEANPCPNYLLWHRGISTKICLRVSSEEELLAYYLMGQDFDFTNTLVTDLGLTCFNNVSTNTVVGWGPVTKEEHEELTKDLKLL